MASHPWSVWADGLQGVATFGPFLPEPDDNDDGLKAAKRFCAAMGSDRYFVYNHVENRRSLCGPWLP